MPSRPFRSLPTSSGTGSLGALEYEVLQEKAFTLSRLAGRLQEALDALAAFDARLAEGSADGVKDAERERRRLVRSAGEALWYLVVQREACGLRDLEPVIEGFRVPREVWLRMGYYPPGAQE